MRIRTVLLSAAVTIALGACQLAPTYPDYAAQANAIADYVLLRALVRDQQCAEVGDCAPTINLNVRQQP